MGVEFLPSPNFVSSLTNSNVDSKVELMSGSATGTPFRKCHTINASWSSIDFISSATTGVGRGDSKGHNGGVWEWTSTVLEDYDGFVPSKLYPG